MKMPYFRCFEFSIQSVDVMLYLMRVLHHRVHTIINNNYAGTCEIRKNIEIYLCIRACVNGGHAWSRGLIAWCDTDL